MQEKKYKWLGLLALVPSIAMIFTDQAILPVALPTIQNHFNATHSQIWWCINSYLLVSAVLLIAGGKLGDLIGHSKIFGLGMLIFAFSSILGGMSGSMSALIYARGLQGLGAALMIPTTSPLIMSLFAQHERGKAMGINISLGSLFLISAPIVGGYFTEVLSWRWIFWVNLPLAFIGVIMQLLFLPSTPKIKERFDLLGFLYFFINSTSLVILVMQGGLWGWGSLQSLTLFTACIVTGILLFQREKKVKHSFIELSFFKHRIYKAVNISIFATQFVIMITIYRTIFFQDVLDWSPIKSGMISFLTSSPILFMSPFGGFLADRFHPKIPIAIGFLSLIASFLSLPFMIEGPLWMVIFGLILFGIGVPLIFTPSYSSAMNAIPPKKAGSAFGILSTVRALSGCLSVALISSFALHVQVYCFQKMASQNSATQFLDPTFLKRLGEGNKVESSLSKEQLPLVWEYLREAKIRGFFWVHLTIALLLIIAFAFVFTFYHRKPSHHPPETPAEGWD